MHYNFTGFPLPIMGQATITPITLRQVKQDDYVDRRKPDPQFLHSALICQGNREEILAIKKDMSEIRSQAHNERGNIRDLALCTLMTSMATALVVVIDFIMHLVKT